METASFDRFFGGETDWECRWIQDRMRGISVSLLGGVIYVWIGPNGRLKIWWLAILFTFWISWI